MKWAKKKTKNKTCDKCKEVGHFNTVPLFEYGDPFIPSEVVLVCKRCGYNEALATMGGQFDGELNKLRQEIDRIMRARVSGDSGIIT